MYVLGVPRYANTAPLYHFLQESEGLRFRYGVPTELNRWLLQDEVQLSLVSSYFFLQNAQRLRALPDFSVADLGPVYSVNLFHRRPWQQLQRIALTTESATSVRLLQLLLAQDGLNPQMVPEHGGLELLEAYDGVLLIGDKAFATYAGLMPTLPESVHQVPTKVGDIWISDLSMRWYERTRLPFVFGVWATQAHQAPPIEVVRQLRIARSLGLGNLAAVAGTEAQRLGVNERLMQHYLWNFRYHLEAPDRLGLQSFAQMVGVAYSENFWEV